MVRVDVVLALVVVVRAAIVIVEVARAVIVIVEVVAGDACAPPACLDYG